MKLLLAILTTLVVLSSSSSSPIFASAGNGKTNNDNSVVIKTSLSDLPPLAKRVLKWSPFEVQLWMNVTVGYPELSSIVKMFLIDGPTLVNMKNIEKVFGPNLHPAQEAKLIAHQKMLRRECACGGGAGDESSASSSAVDAHRSYWTYLEYSSLSTTFHLTAVALAPRFAFFSVWFWDKPLLCCALAVPTTADLESHAVDEEIQMMMSSSNTVNGNTKEGTSTTSASISFYNSPCGVSEQLCSETPSFMTVIIAFFFPWVLMFWHGLLRSFWPHPFISVVWILACFVLQISEVITVYHLFGMIRRKEVSAWDVLKHEVFYGYLDWMFWAPISASIVIGYFLPHWMSYLVLLALTVLAGSNIFTFVWNVLTSMGFVGSGNNQEQPQPQSNGNEQHGEGEHHNDKSSTGGMD